MAPSRIPSLRHREDSYWPPQFRINPSSLVDETDDDDSIEVPDMAVADVAHGGTGVDNLLLHGVLVGQGINPVVVVPPSSQVGWPLLSGGDSANPAYGAPWPPVAPDFTATIIADAQAGRFTDWVYGPVTIPAPVVVTLSTNLNNIGIDMHGSMLICGFNDVAADMLTYICPDGNPDNTNIYGLCFRNMFIVGEFQCRHGLVLSCRLATSGIYGGNLLNVRVSFCEGNGIRMYGDVFEYDLIACYVNNCLNGVEMTNPTAGGGTGVISSIKFIGGDYRANVNCGIISDAETTYQEAVGFHVISVDFIANGWSGIQGGSGIQLVFGTHLERNCTADDTPSHGAVFTYGGPATLFNCDAADNSGKTLYLADIGSANTNQLTNMQNCGVTDEGTGHGMKLGRLFGAGKLIVDYGGSHPTIADNYDGNTAWFTEAVNYTEGTI